MAPGLPAIFAGWGRYKNERGQINQYSEADQQDTDEGKQRKGQGVNPGQTDDFDNEANDDKRAGNSQNRSLR